MEKKEFLKNIEDIRGKVNKLAIDRLNEQPDEEKGIEKKIPEGCIEIPLSEVSYIYQSPFSHNPTVIMKTHEEVTSKRKGRIDLSKLKDSEQYGEERIKEKKMKKEEELEMEVEELKDIKLNY